MRHPYATRISPCPPKEKSRRVDIMLSRYIQDNRTRKSTSIEQDLPLRRTDDQRFKVNVEACQVDGSWAARNRSLVFRPSDTYSILGASL